MNAITTARDLVAKLDMLGIGEDDLAARLIADLQEYQAASAALIDTMVDHAAALVKARSSLIVEAAMFITEQEEGRPIAEIFDEAGQRKRVAASEVTP